MVANTEIVPGTTIARNGFAVLITGRSGQGKSDLALRAIAMPLLLPDETTAAPFRLVADDQTILKRQGDTVFTSAPENLRGLLEVRGIGIITAPVTADVPLTLIAELSGEPVERMPVYPGAQQDMLGQQVDVVEIAPFEASATLKLALALARSACRMTRNER